MAACKADGICLGAWESCTPACQGGHLRNLQAVSKCDRKFALFTWRPGCCHCPLTSLALQVGWKGYRSLQSSCSCRQRSRNGVEGIAQPFCGHCCALRAVLCRLWAFLIELRTGGEIEVQNPTALPLFALRLQGLALAATAILRLVIAALQ